MPPKRPTQKSQSDMFSPNSLGEDFSQKRARVGSASANPPRGGGRKMVNVEEEEAPITAGSPLARNLRLASSDAFTTPLHVHPHNNSHRRVAQSYQEGQGDDVYGSTAVSCKDDICTPVGMSFSVANTQPRRAATTSTSTSATQDETQSSTIDTQLTVDATPDPTAHQSQYQYSDGPSTSVRGGIGASSQITQQQRVEEEDMDDANTPLASQVSSSSAYGNMCVDNPHLESQAQRLELLLSQATQYTTSTTTIASTPIHDDAPTTPDAALCLPHPRRRIAPSTSTGVLTQRDPNTTPLHVQLARVAEPQTCSQGAVGHAEAVQDFLVRYGDGEDEEEDGRALFASPMHAVADTIAALADTPEPTLRRGRGGGDEEDVVVTQLEGSVERGAIGNKRARVPSTSSTKVTTTTARTQSPEPISTTQRQRHEGAEWSRLARQFFEFIDSRPDLSTIDHPKPTTIPSIKGRNKSQQH